MKTKTTIKLLIAALYWNTFARCDVFATQTLSNLKTKDQEKVKNRNSALLSFPTEDPKFFDFSNETDPSPMKSVKSNSCDNFFQLNRVLQRDEPIEDIFRLQQEWSEKPLQLQRRETLSGIFSSTERFIRENLDLELPSIAQKEKALWQIMPILIKKHFSVALPDFITLTRRVFQEKIRGRGGIDDCSLEQLFNFALVDPDTYRYVTRNERPERQSITIYGYASNAIEGRDGIINKIKRNIMDDFILWVSALVSSPIPRESINQLESFLDELLYQIVPSLKRSMFSLLCGDLIDHHRGFFSFSRKINPEMKQQITSGAVDVIGSLLHNFLEKKFGEGARNFAFEMFSNETFLENEPIGDIFSLQREESMESMEDQWKAAMAGILRSTEEFARENSDLELPSTSQKEKALKQIIPILIKKHFSDALPAFVALTRKGFKEEIGRRGGIDDCSLDQLLNFALVDPDTFRYLTRGERPERRSIAVYGYASNAIEGHDGIINRIKRNIMDDFILWVSALISPNIPRKAINQLENFLDKLLEQVIPSLKQSMFTLLRSDFMIDSVGCCRFCRKITPETRQQIASGAVNIIGSVLNHFLGDGFKEGAWNLAIGIFNAINEIRS
ncbi:MAG: hypothetical protein LBI77_03475 [Puniceicoccales bacterium]|jgi:hypothetical protein|nr:hypothetical protein [Puniceicoccales bacterium]